MEQILTATQSTSSEFVPPTSQMVIELTGHAGGTWTLQYEGLDGVWYDVGGISFTDNDIFFVRTLDTRRYRLTGGTAGAQAWAGRWKGDA